jgi:hypothetical protein
VSADHDSGWRTAPAVAALGLAGPVMVLDQQIDRLLYRPDDPPPATAPDIGLANGS